MIHEGNMTNRESKGTKSEKQDEYKNGYLEREMERKTKSQK